MKIIDYSVGELERILKKALDIDASSDYNLDREIIEHSKAHARWAFLLARAAKEKRLAELDLKSIAAELTAKIRAEYAKNKTPLPKSYNVEKELLPLEKEWKDAVRKVIEHEEYYTVLSSIDRAWHNRAYLLGCLSRNRDREPKVTISGRASQKRSEDLDAKMMVEYQL